MKRDLKDAWVSALRSREYAQGKGLLKSCEGTYCCLGVLGEVLVKAGQARFETRGNGSSMFWLESTDPPENYGGIPDRSGVKIPPALRDKIELPSRVQSRLVDMNDNEGQDFYTIAAFIEENL